MKYDLFKKARKFGKDEANKGLLDKMGECEDMLGIIEWMKNNGNKDAEGKPKFKASITLNVHGRSGEDANEKDVRSFTYETNFDFIEKKLRENYDGLVREFESKSGE